MLLMKLRRSWGSHQKRRKYMATPASAQLHEMCKTCAAQARIRCLNQRIAPQRIFKFCRSKCHAAFKKKKNPRKTKWTKAYRKTAGKELAVDPSFQFEKKRNIPIIYTRDLWGLVRDSMMKVEEIKEKRGNAHIMQRLRKGRSLEVHRDIELVKRDLGLIRSPAAGLKERKKIEDSIEMLESMVQSDDDNEPEAEAIAN